MKRIYLLTVISTLLLLSFLGCDDENKNQGEDIPLADSIDYSFILNHDSIILYLGEMDTLIATTLNGDSFPYWYKIMWSINNPSIAEVFQNGVVSAMSGGTAVITATCEGVKCTCKVVVIERQIEYEYVDLGLSVKWATFNVGAYNPSSFGDYFAWGEIEPYYEAGYAIDRYTTVWKSGKTNGYDWASYKFLTSGDSLDNFKFSKYNTSSSYGTVDNKIVLDPEDDVAHVKWGGSWRMPTQEELNELLYNCTWTWTYKNGMYGFNVTSNIEGYTNRSIFLPAAGRREGIYIDRLGELSDYWSSSLSTDNPYRAWSLVCNEDVIETNYYSNRYRGKSVRPVCP